jgi:hypothetical protein
LSYIFGYVYINTVPKIQDIQYISEELLSYIIVYINTVSKIQDIQYVRGIYKNQLSQQTGSRNLMGPKTFPTIWGTYMKLVTKYQISAINSC